MATNVISLLRELSIWISHKSCQRFSTHLIQL